LDVRESSAGPPSPNKEIEGLGAGVGAAAVLGICFEARGWGTGFDGRGFGTDLEGRASSALLPCPNKDIEGLGADVRVSSFVVTCFGGRGFGTDLDGRFSSAGPSPNKDIEGLGAGAGAAFRDVAASVSSK
jgi:hypothetical protein